MTAQRIRIDFDKTVSVSRNLAQQASLVNGALRKLKGSVDVLKGGDWVGAGADRFYQDMDSTLLPSLQRLAAALEASAQTAIRIEAIMHQAEEEAAALFRNGNGFGSGVAAGDTSALFSAMAKSGSTGAGKAGGRQTKPKILAGLDPKVVGQIESDRVLLAKLERLDREGWTIELAKGKGDMENSIHRGPPRKIILNPKYGREGLNDAVNDALYGDMKILNNIDPKVAAQVKREPVLMEQLRQLEKQKWTVEMGKDRAITDYMNKVLSLDPKHPLESLKENVTDAARYPDPEPIGLVRMPSIENDGIVRDVWVENQVFGSLQADGRQVLSYYQAYNEAYGHYPEILPMTTNGKRGKHWKDYQTIAKKYHDGSMDEYGATYAMAQFMRDENSGISNYSKWRDQHSDEWDLKFHPEQFANDRR